MTDSLTRTITNTSASYDVLVIYYDVIQIKTRCSLIEYTWIIYGIIGSRGHLALIQMAGVHSVYTVRIKDIGSPANIVFPQTFKENQESIGPYVDHS